MFANAKNAYVDSSVSTASPERLLVMLCERLVLDVQRAVEALRTGDHPASHDALMHAQEIVVHLRSTLKVEAWDGGPGLASLYDWLHSQLIRANVHKDAATTEGCLTIVEDLAAIWRDAALASASATG
jgi:flagellar protein FliS